MVSLTSSPDKHQVSFSLSSLLFSSHPHKTPPDLNKIALFHNQHPQPHPSRAESASCSCNRGRLCCDLQAVLLSPADAGPVQPRPSRREEKTTCSDSRFRPQSAASSITGSLLAVEVRPAAGNAPASSPGEDETHPSSLQGFEFYFLAFTHSNTNYRKKKTLFILPKDEFCFSKTQCIRLKYFHLTRISIFCLK